MNIQPHAPTPLEVEQSKHLLQLLEGHPRAALTVQSEGMERPEIIPAGVATLLTDILKQTANGQSLVVLPVDSELSSQEAADYLRVSRQYLVLEAEAGKVAFRKVGTHRRFALSDILIYSQELRRISLEARQELADESQRLELDR